MKLCPECSNGLVGSPSRCSVCSADLTGVEPVGEDGLAGMLIGDGRYELTELIGEGGAAWVYRGIHKGLERDVAVKLLKSAPAKLAAEQSKRFEREARMASRLNHPHIVSVIDFGRTPSGLMYLVTEYIQGKPLSLVLWEERPLPTRRVIDIFHQVLAAVEEAHGAGVIHRDIKPENILVTALRSGEDFVKVVDFGIAVPRGRPDGKVTQAGAFIGTPGFMSPEQIQGEEATERSDIYALGVMLYEMLSGRAAFEGDSPVGVMTRQLDGDPLSLSEAAPELGCATVFDEVIARAANRVPAQRYASVTEIRNALHDATSRMSQVDLDCTSCSRPVDPDTGLCRLHRGATAPLGAVIAVHTPTSRPGPAEFRVAAEQLTAPSIVGRALEHREIAGFLNGSSAVLLLSGLAGAGKTELARAVARVGTEEGGLRVFRVGPDPLRSVTPWYPVRELVGQALGCGPAPGSPAEYERVTSRIGFSDVDEAGLGLLFGFELRRAPQPGPARRNAIHSTAVRVLTECAGESGGPWIIAEDAHEYDAASMDFFRALGAIAAGTGIKALVTAQRDPGGWAGAHQHLALGPLGEAATAELVDRLLADAPRSVRVRAQGAVEASGLPAYAVEAARLLREGGDPAGTLDEIVEARLDLVPRASLRLLQIVALVGSRVPVELLGALVAEEQLSTGLDLLGRRQLITTSPDGAVSIASPIAARVALEALSRPERRELARMLLNHLTDTGASVFVLARLADEAGEFERAVDLLQRAGDEARRFEDVTSAAMVHYRRAAHLVRWELLMPEEDETYLRISLEIGRALSSTGHRKAAEVVYKEIVAAADRHPEYAAKAQQGLGALFES